MKLSSKYQWLLLSLFIILSVTITGWWLLFDGLAVLQNQIAYFTNHENYISKKTLWLSIYAVVCLVSQLLIVPSGSLILIAAGFIFSPIAATAIFSLAQVLCSWPVYKMGAFISRKYPEQLRRWVQKFQLPANFDHAVQQEGFYTTVVLRLTPVIPSAAACLIASGLGIGLRSFIPATIAVCWIRPLFFASMGGSLQSLTNLTESVDSKAVAPLLLVFFAALALLVVKIILHYKSRNT